MIRVYPRKDLDHSFGDLFTGLALTLSPNLEKKTIEKEIENLWPKKNLITGLSVRTIFDSLLTIKDFDDGSEVIMSGITIPDMVKIVQSHKLNIVSVDMDMKSLQVDKNSILSAITEKTVMVVVAHLFGSKMEMEHIYDALNDYPDIMIVEDCAQAFDGVDGYVKGRMTDISLFSFGTIKSITALGGAIAFTKDQELKNNLKASLELHPKIENIHFLSKVLKYIILKILGRPFIYGLFIQFTRLMGIDYDKAIISTVRMVKDGDLLNSIRKNLTNSQLRYLLYRFTNMKKDHLQKRIEAGNYVKERLNNVKVHGTENNTHSYWLFPIRTSHKSSLVKSLRDAGFDATFISTQLIAINSSATNNSPIECKKYMDDTIYLPVYGSMPKKALDILISVVNEGT
tara:strand:+ start:3169 stop:4368 length:1200 start_codon:yes stop_codon:yes gene_type:complete